MPKPRDPSPRTEPDAAPVAAARPSSPPPAPPRFTKLAALVAHLGASSLDEANTVLAHPDQAALAERGRTFATTRGSDDALRIYGGAVTFLESAPKAVQAKVAITPGLLRVGAWVALQADTAYAAQTRKAADRRIQRDATSARADEASGGARAVRDQLADVVASVAGNDPALAARLADARSAKSADGREQGPVASLGHMVALAREMLGRDDAGVRARCGFFDLTPARVDEAARLVDGASEVAQEAAAPKVAADVHRTDVEVLDGMNYQLMERVIAIFAKAAARDVTVPKLRFISLQVRATKKKPADGKTPPDA